MIIREIPLERLSPSSINVRKTNAKSGIEQLAASIEAHGLLQNLQVVERDGAFEVVAGARRLAALLSLAKQKKLAADFAVPCNVLDLNETELAEVSLAENEARLAMHPADQFTAFKKLANGGMGEESIAARFGVTPSAVKQRLKLAVVSPKLIAAYRKGDMTLEQLMAFTVSDDRKAQETVWAELPEWARRRGTGDAIRDQLTEAHVDIARDKLAKFVGAAAYVKAGGHVLRDLFDDEGKGWMTDAALLQRLADEKLKKAAAKLEAEGWKWIEIRADFDYSDQAKFGKLKAGPSEKTKAEIERLSEELAKLDPFSDEYEELLERLNELMEEEGEPTPEQKGKGGCIVTIGYDGKTDIKRGLIRPEDAKAAAKAAIADKDQGVEGQGADQPHAKGLSAKLVEELTIQRTVAIAARLATQPHTALAAVTHALAMSCLIDGHGSPAVKVRGTSFYPGAAVAQAKAVAELDARRQLVTKGMPKDKDELFGWMLKQEDGRLLDILALCAAMTVDSVERKRSSFDSTPDMANAAELAEAVELDMADYWQATAEGYFSRVSKAQILEAVDEALTPLDRKTMEPMKKGELAKLAEEKMRETRWLPPILRP